MPGIVHLLTTGGTIASSEGAEGRNVSGAVAGETLLEAVRNTLPADCTVRPESLLQKPSNAITPDDELTIARRCEVLLAEPQTVGIVITHGTDTLEDTAFFLDLALGDVRCPVVLTGSQRALHETGSDARRNLTDALLVASHPASVGRGVLVVFDESIHAGRLARKVHSYRVTGFDSPGYGPIGRIDAGRVHYALRPELTPALTLGDRMPRVDLLAVGLGSDCLAEEAVNAGAKGLVIAGLGRGHVPPGWMAPLGRILARATPVIITTSTAAGPVGLAYEFPGSLASLMAEGAVPAGDLTARQARILLMVLLSTPTDPAHVQRQFQTRAGQHD